MKIIELRAENIKRLKAVTIRPSGNVVEITGANGAGKTSTLDALWWAFADKKAIQKSPIRAGEESALIRVDLGEILITRTFRTAEDGTYTTKLVVENADGMRSGKPQELLDALVGALSFDPLEFTRQKPAEQFDTLKKFVPGVDFDEISRLNREDYDLRRDINRDLKAAKTRLEAMPAPTVPARVDEAALLAKLNSAHKNNGDIEARQARRDGVRQQFESLTASAASKREQALALRQQAAALDQQAADDESSAMELKARLDNAGPLPAPVDTSALLAEIEAARETNAKADRAERLARERSELEAEVAKLEANSVALTKAMEEREAAKKEAIAKADMPVPGLSFGDGEILLNGVPFEQGSDAEQLRASVAIAAALNPKLRVIRVRDGSLLGENSMRLLAEMADERDMQVWIETVESDRPGAIVIEDGQVASAPALQAAE